MVTSVSMNASIRRPEPAVKAARRPGRRAPLRERHRGPRVP
jgi:hypothetical protein